MNQLRPLLPLALALLILATVPAPWWLIALIVLLICDLTGLLAIPPHLHFHHDPDPTRKPTL